MTNRQINQQPSRALVAELMRAEKQFGREEVRKHLNISTSTYTSLKKRHFVTPDTIDKARRVILMADVNELRERDDSAKLSTTEEKSVETTHNEPEVKKAPKNVTKKRGGIKPPEYLSENVRKLADLTSYSEVGRILKIDSKTAKQIAERKSMRDSTVSKISKKSLEIEKALNRAMKDSLVSIGRTLKAGNKTKTSKKKKTKKTSKKTSKSQAQAPKRTSVTKKPKTDYKVHPTTTPTLELLVPFPPDVGNRLFLHGVDFNEFIQEAVEELASRFEMHVDDLVLRLEGKQRK